MLVLVRPIGWLLPWSVQSEFKDIEGLIVDLRSEHQRC